MAARKKSTKPRASKKGRIKDLDAGRRAQQVRGGNPTKPNNPPPKTRSFELNDFGFDVTTM